MWNKENIFLASTISTLLPLFQMFQIISNEDLQNSEDRSQRWPWSKPKFIKLKETHKTLQKLGDEKKI